MLTLRRKTPREDVSVLSSSDRPVLLATLDVPFSEEATAFAVDSAVESGRPLVVVHAGRARPVAGRAGRAPEGVQPASDRRASRARGRAQPGHPRLRARPCAP